MSVIHGHLVAILLIFFQNTKLKRPFVPSVYSELQAYVTGHVEL